MQNGFRIVFWGLIVATFHINLGSLQLLPPFIGWCIIASGVNKLYQVYTVKTLNKAHTVSMVLILISLVGEVFQYSGISNEITVYWPVVFIFTELYFIYYLLAGSVEALNIEGKYDLAAGYESKLRNYMILFMINAALECIALTIYDSTLLFIITGASFLLMISLIFIVNGLKMNFE